MYIYQPIAALCFVTQVCCCCHDRNPSINAGIVRTIRRTSREHYADAASHHADAVLRRVFFGALDKGFKPEHAAEVAAMLPESATQISDEEYGMLRALKGY